MTRRYVRRLCLLRGHGAGYVVLNTRLLFGEQRRTTKWGGINHHPPLGKFLEIFFSNNAYCLKIIIRTNIPIKEGNTFRKVAIFKNF